VLIISFRLKLTNCMIKSRDLALGISAHDLVSRERAALVNFERAATGALQVAGLRVESVAGLIGIHSFGVFAAKPGNKGKGGGDPDLAITGREAGYLGPAKGAGTRGGFSRFLA